MTTVRHTYSPDKSAEVTPQQKRQGPRLFSGQTQINVYFSPFDLINEGVSVCVKVWTLRVELKFITNLCDINDCNIEISNERKPTFHYRHKK